ncbi:MAG: VCBS repeat-containing protein [Myxococcales bacterium]|nr:VCBS repeat-containing protein [Myxococcales bacterium]
MIAYRSVRHLAAALALAGALASFACDSAKGTFSDGNGPPDGDVNTGQLDGGGGDIGPGTCPAVPCPNGMVCAAGQCVPDTNTCASDEDCQGDSYCDATTSVCVPYAPPGGGSGKTHDDTCKGAGFTAEKLAQPKVQCSWTKTAVINAPVVADLDGDKKPEILFITFTGSTIAAGSIVALNGADCAELWVKPASLGTRSQLAVADLDNDGKLEIVGIGSDNKVRVFDYQGNLLATAAQAALGKGATSFNDGGAAIANLDGQGPPEIVYGGQALRYQAGTLTQLYNVAGTGGHWGIMSVVADIDLDGKPDVVMGNKILDGITGADKTPPGVSSFPGGYVAIAQWDKSTPEPEVVLISSQTGQPGAIRIYNPKTGNVVFGPYTFGQRWGGPPTVADFDGDGEPEVAAAGYVGYAVFDQECAATPMPAFCDSPGVRWLKTTKDNSSGSTGSSVFDFNGDGQAEVVYRDECWLRVYDGKTGQVRFAQAITSGTILELPVIADVDNDGHADLVVPSHNLSSGCTTEPELNLPFTGGTQGIFVLRDPQNRWMPSRAIWNQHSYHITNINDDGTVPAVEKDNWLTWNNYRQNTQGLIKGDQPAPDITARQQDALEPSSNCKTAWKLQARICNRGTNKAGAGVPGTFYQGDPRSGGTAICTATTTQALDPGQCESVSCEWAAPPSEKVDLWFQADDDGAQQGKEVECKEKNNLLHMPESRCLSIG